MVGGSMPAKPATSEQEREIVTGRTSEEKEIGEATSESVRNRMSDILKEYNLHESEIPLNHEYWNLRNRYSDLKAQEDSKKERK